jgi:predicted alpha/beta-fold hydrolase
MTPLARILFRTTSALSPRLTAGLAHWLFSTPLKVNRLSPAEKRLILRADAKLAESEKVIIATAKHGVAAYRFGKKSGPDSETIVLVHGWMSGARFMLAIMQRLVDAGYEVICFDLPAHGNSSGKSTNLIECAEALCAVIHHFGPVDTVIAHSFGGAVTAYALAELGDAKLSGKGRIILLASPNQLAEVTKSFSRQMAISDAARLVFERKLCAPFGQSITAMDGNLLYKKAGYPLHVIHCADDAEVSVEEGRRFREIGGQTHYIELKGLGHRRILYAEKALEALLTNFPAVIP